MGESALSSNTKQQIFCCGNCHTKNQLDPLRQSLTSPFSTNMATSEKNVRREELTY